MKLNLNARLALILTVALIAIGSTVVFTVVGVNAQKRNAMAAADADHQRSVAGRHERQQPPRRRRELEPVEEEELVGVEW